MDFKKIVESSPFTILKWSNTAGWPIEYASENIFHLTGYKAEDFISEKLNFFELLNEQDLLHIDEQIRKAQTLLIDEFKLEKYAIPQADTSPIWVEEYVYVLRSEAGHVTGYIGYLLDISTRIETEAELLTSRNETRALINALPDTILHISKNGELKQYLSRKSEPLSKKTTEVYLTDIFPPAFAARIPELLDEVIQNKSISIHEYEKLSQQQETQYYEARFSEKSPEDALIIIRDITERKNNEQLLNQAINDAQVANNEKTRFLSNMSHELRTPLNAIMGFSQLLMTDDNDDAPLAEEIYNAGDHLLSLINDILDISSIEAGKIQISVEPVAIFSVIKECESIISTFAQNSNIHYTSDLPEPELLVLGDKTRLTQVLINLMSNAIKYNKPNGTVTLSSKILDNKHLYISITDTGIGLTAQQQARLFKPFERVGAENTNIEGTGLGLALTKKFVELMGGVIGIESEPTKGSTFWITIPIAEELGPDITNIDANISSIGADQQASLDIIYIEDNPQNQRLIQQLISKRTNHRVRIARTGAEGIDMILQQTPDMIMLDLNLPDISGYDVLTKLRTDDKTNRIPVIAISANATREDIKQAEQAGLHSYLTKPIDVTKLLQTIESIL